MGGQRIDVALGEHGIHDLSVLQGEDLPHRGDPGVGVCEKNPLRLGGGLYRHPLAG